MEYENGSFEKPIGVAVDETDISLRAYMTRIPVRKLLQYDPSWTDQQVMAWDDNFRDDGELFLVCCERDVGVDEYRAVLHEYLEFRRRQGVGQQQQQQQQQQRQQRHPQRQRQRQPEQRRRRPS